MFYEKNNKLFFCFIDFGSSFDLENKEGKNKTKTFSPHYSSPEQNTLQESFSSKLKLKINKIKNKNKEK